MQYKKIVLQVNKSICTIKYVESSPQSWIHFDYIKRFFFEYLKQRKSKRYELEIFFFQNLNEIGYVKSFVNRFYLHESKRNTNVKNPLSRLNLVYIFKMENYLERLTNGDSCSTFHRIIHKEFG